MVSLVLSAHAGLRHTIGNLVISLGSPSLPDIEHQIVFKDGVARTAHISAFTVNRRREQCGCTYQLGWLDNVNTDPNPDVLESFRTAEADEIAISGKTYARKINDINQLVMNIQTQPEIEAVLLPWMDKLSFDEWNEVISEVGRKHWKLALKVFNVLTGKAELSQQRQLPDNGFRLSTNGSFNNPRNLLKAFTNLIALLSRHGRIEEVETSMQALRKEGLEPDLYLYNALLGVYANKGMVEHILDYMVQMQKLGIQPDRITYEKLIAAYLKLEVPKVKQAFEVLDGMKKSNMRASSKTFSDLIKACWQISEIDVAEKAFVAMINAGYSPDIKVWAKLIQMNAEKGIYSRAEELLHTLRESGVPINSSLFEYLLLSYCKAGCLNQAFSIFRECKLATKPSIVAYNIIISACTKAGLHAQAFQLYADIYNTGMKPNAITYTSTIMAMVEAGKYDKAAELYKKMSREKISPSIHTFTTMIHAYSIRGWTKVGHEVCNALRKSNCKLNLPAYGVMLNLYLRGSWYTHAADVLKEMENRGFELDAASSGALISACGESGVEISPLIKTIERSNWQICRVICTLILPHLVVSPHSPLLTEDAGLPEHVLRFFKHLSDSKDTEANLSFYNALMDALWRRGLKGRAKLVMIQARSLLPSYKHPKYSRKDWVLDVRGLSIGGAQIALLDWLNDAAHKPPLGESQRMILVTGSGRLVKQLKDHDNQTFGLNSVIRAVLAELGSPFTEATELTGRLEADLVDVKQWYSMHGIQEALSLIDCGEAHLSM